MLHMINRYATPSILLTLVRLHVVLGEVSRHGPGSVAPFGFVSHCRRARPGFADEEVSTSSLHRFIRSIGTRMPTIRAIKRPCFCDDPRVDDK